MQVFLTLLIIFLVILLLAIISFYLLYLKISHLKKEKLEVSHWVIYWRNIALGIVIFALSAIIINLFTFYG